MTRFLQRPWFIRIWVVQEVVLASRVIVACAKEKIDWSTLASVVVMISGNGLDRQLDIAEEGGISTLAEGVPGVTVTYSIKSIRNAGSPVPLQINLLDTWRFEATDASDKLFALLGIVSDAEDSALSPDYRSTAQDVFKNSTRYLINRDRSVQILHAAGLGFPDHSSICLPGCRTGAISPQGRSLEELLDWRSI